MNCPPPPHTHTNTPRNSHRTTLPQTHPTALSMPSRYQQANQPAPPSHADCVQLSPLVLPVPTACLHPVPASFAYGGACKL
jgi:hypothetical protein